MQDDPKIRLYLDHPLGPAQSLPLTRDQAGYLFRVMRLGPGAEIAVFNGHDGEWRAEVTAAGRHGGALECRSLLRPQSLPPDLWLLFAPIRKERTDFIVEKAAEMGVQRILPVRTDRTQAGRIQRDRLQAHAIEAAEQCGNTFVPEVAELAPLSAVLDGWEAARPLTWCDEALADGPAPDTAADETPRGAVLIGPAGGFSPAERARLAAMPAARPTRLGPRILRADTAAVAALALWQLRHGDWR